MKNRRWMKWVVYTVCVCGLALSAQARKKEITLVLVPREDATKRLGLDIANRYPTLLVGYRVAPNGTLSLHGWTGTKWVNIALDDYVAGNFFKKGPNSALIVEKDGVPVPENLVPPVDWCMDVSKITTTRLRPLIHLTGQYFDFSHKDWKWFAKRYGMEIDAINPEGLNTAWYHKRLNEHLKSGKPVGSDDLQYWVSIRQTVIAEPSVAGEGAPEAAEPGAGQAVDDPFTNAVPPAVVMGAGDVPEEHADGEVEKETAEESNPEEKEEKTPDGME